MKKVTYEFWKNCIGHGNSMLDVEEVKNQWGQMIKTIEQQQEEIERYKQALEESNHAISKAILSDYKNKILFNAYESAKQILQGESNG